MPPTASDLITTWEHGLEAPAGERARELAALARPDLGEPEVDALSAGERDAALLDLRELLFGSSIDAVLSCASCGETLELTHTIDELRASEPSSREETGTIQHHGYEVSFRPPTTLDLAEIGHELDVDRARDALLARCVLEARAGGGLTATRDLPHEVVALLDAALAAADPQADIELAVECPACGDATATSFDIATFLWSELERYALGMLREIHVLASAYGWSEAEIIALGPRRQLYLELIEG